MNNYNIEAWNKVSKTWKYICNLDLSGEQVKAKLKEQHKLHYTTVRALNTKASDKFHMGFQGFYYLRYI